QPDEQVLALAVDAGDAMALDAADEHLLRDAAHRTRAVHLDGLDAPADDLLLEVPAERLDLGELRHWRAPSGGRARPAGPPPARPASSSAPGPRRAPAGRRRRPRG